MPRNAARRRRQEPLVFLTLLVAASFTAGCGTRVVEKAGSAATPVNSSSLATDVPVAAGAAPAAVAPVASPASGAPAAPAAASMAAPRQPTGAPVSRRPPTPGAGASAVPGGADGQTTGGAAAAVKAPSAPAGSNPSLGTPDLNSSRSTVVIGSVSTLSGPAGELLRGAVEGVQLWVRWINDRGGLRGHPVRYVVADDGGDSARHLALLQQLKERERVLAFVQNQEPFAGPSVNDWHRRNRIPVIGTEGAGNYPYDNPMYFPAVSTGDEFAVSMAGGVAAVAVPEGRTAVALLVCVESEGCINGERVWTGPRVKALGLNVVYKAKISLTQPDFTAQCLGARNAGAQTLVVYGDINTAGRVAAACRRQDYRPLIGLFSNQLVASTAANADLDGAVIAVQHFPWMASDTPGRQEFQAAFARYLPKVAILPAHGLGWLNGKVFELAGMNLPEPPTTDAILDGLWSIKDNDLGGLTYPLTFARDQNPPRRACWSSARLKNQQYSAVSTGISCERR